ncbi:MAG: NAD(P)/FAD-dependent oxidoreductase, partial [Vicinamibacterales bacterium]
MRSTEVDALVIGGGFYGAVLAEALAVRFANVALLESASQLLSRASYHNQARVHAGYHYPRSLLTAQRSQVNARRFLAEYGECVDGTFQKIYAIARKRSNVSAAQFWRFAHAIDAPIREASAQHRSLFDMSMVEAVFEVEELAFNALSLRERVARRLRESAVQVRTSSEVTRIEALSGKMLRAHVTGPEPAFVDAPLIYNCTYSRLNRILVASGVRPLQLRHELTEVALVQPPPELSRVGVTLMCGPFFSCMPFPASRLHSLTHVRYTPHVKWSDMPDESYVDADEILTSTARRTRVDEMRRDAARYLPALRGATYVDSLWE